MQITQTASRAKRYRIIHYQLILFVNSSSFLNLAHRSPYLLVICVYVKEQEVKAFAKKQQNEMKSAKKEMSSLSKEQQKFMIEQKKIVHMEQVKLSSGEFEDVVSA